MADKTKIKSVNHTQNLWIGCTKVSEGCEHCYAEAMDRYWPGDNLPNGKGMLLRPER